MFGNNFTNQSDILQIYKTVSDVQCVQIMAIIFFVFMCFKEIYLLGVHHDWFITKS